MVRVVSPRQQMSAVSSLCSVLFIIIITALLISCTETLHVSGYTCAKDGTLHNGFEQKDGELVEIRRDQLGEHDNKAVLLLKPKAEGEFEFWVKYYPGEFDYKGRCGFERFKGEGNGCGVIAEERSNELMAHWCVPDKCEAFRVRCTGVPMGAVDEIDGARLIVFSSAKLKTFYIGCKWTALIANARHVLIEHGNENDWESCIPKKKWWIWLLIGIGGFFVLVFIVGIVMFVLANTQNDSASMMGPQSFWQRTTQRASSMVPKFMVIRARPKKGLKGPTRQPSGFAFKPKGYQGGMTTKPKPSTYVYNK